MGVLPKAEQRVALHMTMGLPEMGTEEGLLKCEVQGLLSQLQPSLYLTSVSTWALRGPPRNYSMWIGNSVAFPLPSLI